MPSEGGTDLVGVQRRDWLEWEEKRGCGCGWLIGRYHSHIHACLARQKGTTMPCHAPTVGDFQAVLDIALFCIVLVSSRLHLSPAEPTTLLRG